MLMHTTTRERVRPARQTNPVSDELPCGMNHAWAREGQIGAPWAAAVTMTAPTPSSGLVDEAAAERACARQGSEGATRSLAADNVRPSEPTTLGGPSVASGATIGGGWRHLR